MMFFPEQGPQRVFLWEQPRLPQGQRRLWLLQVEQHFGERRLAPYWRGDDRRWRDSGVLRQIRWRDPQAVASEWVREMLTAGCKKAKCAVRLPREIEKRVVVERACSPAS